MAEKHRANGSVPFARRDEVRDRSRTEDVEHVTTEGKMTKKRPQLNGLAPDSGPGGDSQSR